MKEATKEKLKDIRTMAVDIAVATGIVLAVVSVVRPVIVSGVSMLPNFKDRDYVFMYRHAYDKKTPKAGDVVVFKVKEGTEEEQLYIKRVIATEGETLTIRDGKVYVNGIEQDQSFTKEGHTAGNIDELKVPAGEIFVMGDNRDESNDSRAIGTIALSRIEGKVVYRLFPIKKAGGIPTFAK